MTIALAALIGTWGFSCVPRVGGVPDGLDSTGQKKAELRVMHMADPKVDLRVSIAGRMIPLAYGKSSGYVLLAPGAYDVGIFASDEDRPSVRTTIEVERTDRKSMLLFLHEGGLKARTVDDIQEQKKAETRATLRVIVGSNMRSQVDVYQSTSKGDRVLFSELRARDVSKYKVVTPGASMIHITLAGRREVAAKIQAKGLEPGQAYTVVLDGQLNSSANNSLQARLFVDDGMGKLSAVLDAKIEINATIVGRAKLRLNHVCASLSGKVALWLNGKRMMAVARGSSTGFLDLKPGEYALELRGDADGKVLATKELSLFNGSQRDLYLHENSAGAVELLTATNSPATEPDRARLRVFHAVKGRATGAVELGGTVLRLFGELSVGLSAYKSVDPGSYPLEFYSKDAANTRASFDPIRLARGKDYTLVLMGDWSGQVKSELKAFVLVDNEPGPSQSTQMNDGSRVVPVMMLLATSVRGGIEIFVDGALQRKLSNNQRGRLLAMAQGTREITIKAAEQGTVLWRGQLNLSSRKPHTLAILRDKGQWKTWAFEDKKSPKARDDQALLRVLNTSSLKGAFRLQSRAGASFEQLHSHTNTGFRAVAAGSWEWSLEWMGSVLPAAATLEASLQANTRYTLVIADKASDGGIATQKVQLLLIAHPSY